ncbi:MAG: sodium:solute symporter family protein [Cyanobacteriota/Melainabacteria group bacterium]
MNLIDVIILVAFLAHALSAGFRAKDQASENLEEYFLAGRSLKGWQAGLSMAATQFAADTPLLVTGLIATAGIFSLWRMWIYAVAFLLMGFVLAPSWRRSMVITDAELTEIRYGRKPAAVLRGIKAMYAGTLLNCIGLAIVLLAATRIAEPFLIWNQWLPDWLFLPVETLVKAMGTPLTISKDIDQIWTKSTNNFISILVIALTSTLYSTTGGLRSVVATDVVQFAIGLAGSLVYAFFIIATIGGLPELFTALSGQMQNGGPGGITIDQLLAFSPSQAKDMGLILLTVIGIQWLTQMNSDGSGYLAQRTMACRSDKDAKLASIVFVFAQLLLRGLTWLPIALGLLVLFPPDPTLSADMIRAERETTFVRGIVELLPPGARGLMMVGMLAALASTIDTHLNWGSSYWTNDIYKRFIAGSILKREPSARSLVWVARGSNIVILSIAIFVMTKLSSIQDAWKQSLLFGAGIGIVLVLRWLWWRINVWAEIACMVVSILMVPVLLVTMPDSQGSVEGLRILILVGISLMVAILVSYLAPSESMDRLVEFYKRVKPPGFWAPVAIKAGLDPDEPRRRLLRAGTATAVASFSFFCLLAGIGSWICNSPSPVWLPDRTLWIVGLIALSIALLPVWWRLAFTSEEPESSSPVHSPEAPYRSSSEQPEDC